VGDRERERERERKKEMSIVLLYFLIVGIIFLTRETITQDGVIDRIDLDTYHTTLNGD
jgi:hypothetical protein